MTRAALVLLVLLAACSMEASILPEEDAPGAGADAGPAADDPLRVDTDRGPVIGMADGDLRVFLGVPFAAPPVGALRLRRPHPHEPWDAPRAADRAGPPCPQRDGDAVVGDEDCLYLNVWAHERDGGARPVMVFLHGGANVAGSASEPLYDGAALARATGAVVVTADYRLGALGFMALPELADEAGDGETGTYGVLDQQAALRWVQANAASFGGDAQQVMLFGESA